MVNMDRKNIDEIISEIISLLKQKNKYLKRSVITAHLVEKGLMGENIPKDWQYIVGKIETNDYGIKYTGRFRGRRYYLDSTPTEIHCTSTLAKIAYQILKDSPRELRMSEIVVAMKKKGEEDGVKYIIVDSYTTHIQRALLEHYPNEFTKGSKRGFWMLKGTHEINDPNFPNYCSECGHGLIGKPKFCSQCGVKIKFRSWV
jgi:hypothetical protein